jgi:nanoRNase/pAp phosphatase (c-di-AMP/oligoRNAs hydrolase)
MEVLQQIIAKITQVSSILIIVPGHNGDSLASGLALRAFLKKLEKDVTLLSPSAISPKFDFLPGVNEVSATVDLTKSFVIDLSTKKSEVGELSYHKEEDKLSIYLKPKKGEFTAQDVSFRSSNFSYDLIILVGVSALDQLGDFYSQNTALFFETPLVNIDFRSANESYAPFNLIGLSATSCAEIILDLINKFEASLLDDSIATQLLAGIISETNSFQHVRTTPDTFLKASQLVSLGAKQQEIIAHLYKTKSLGFLKLWGRVLARLKQEMDLGLVYSAVTLVDVVKSEASEDDALMIIKEMVSQLGFAKILLLLIENENNGATVFCHSFIPLSLVQVFKQYPTSLITPQTIKFTTNKDIASTETELKALIHAEVARLNPTV